MYDFERCPRCSGPISCLSVRSTHLDNWYCANTENCGWSVWTKGQQKGTQAKEELVWKGTASGQLPPNGSDYKLMEQRSNVPNK